jgi:hypothetical protein
MSDEDDELLTRRAWSGQREAKLSWLQQPEQPPSRKPETDPDDRTYKAFELHDRADCIEIERVNLPSRLPSYSYLIDVSYDHHHHSAMTLFYSFGMVVEITGRNLYEVMHAIKYRQCDHIRPFNPKRHDLPVAGQSLITEINIHTGSALADPPPK